eukprot:TRINITY_DN40974_c0_g1_i1.p2 TRINITY_DN40974_c0_g1~~TRINITY_DN40974_c0_g1_i1.p2  ORF type:complete len:200 (-),score=9.86 TRINITY_DN40974_c0_g1_i1:197-796(-)
MSLPIPPPIPAPKAERVCVFGDQYILDYDTILICSSPHLRLSDAWKVLDLDGKLIFKTADKLLEIRDKKVLVNAENQPICTMVEKMFTMHSTSYVCAGSSHDTDNALFTGKVPIRSDFPKIDVYMSSNMTDTPDYVIYGSFDKLKFKIFSRSRKVLAEVAWDCFSHHMMHTVTAKIAAGMDLAFAVILMQMAMETLVTL